MGTRKTKKRDTAPQSRSSEKVKELLDALIAEASATPQFDSFYAAKARALQESGEDFFPIFAKRFLKATHRERELLLPLLRHMQGIAHITFLQDFINREPFLPRTGMMILEIFNKSDAMVESGVTGRLLELDALARRITHSLVQGSLDTALLQEFIKRAPLEREGILAQLREETGVQCALLVASLLAHDAPLGMQILQCLTHTPDELSLKILNDVYAKTGSKEVAKVLKKTAHSLRQKGIVTEIAVPEEKPQPVFQQAVLPEPRAFISIVDADGIRIVFLIKPVSIYETKIFNVLMSDRKGIHDIEVITALRRDTRKFIKRLLDDTKIEFLETEVPYATFLVEEASRLTQERGGIIPETMAQLRSAFADSLGTRQTPLVYDVISSEEIAAAREAVTPDDVMHATHSMYWFAVTPEARDSWMKLANILYSPIVLSDEQKQSRIEEFVKETAIQFFTPERCRQFKRRLEESAYFLFKKDRRTLAAAALAAAQNFVAADIVPADIPLCCSIIRGTFALFEKAYKKSGAPPTAHQTSGSGGTTASA